MILTGRLIGRVQERWLMIAGFSILAFSMHEMSQINLYVSNSTIIWIGMIQGIGMSLATVPMTTAAYSTLAPGLRTEGASMFTLMRNMGGSVGISVLFTQIARSTQINHQQIGETLTPFADSLVLPSSWNWNTEIGATLLDNEVTRQATSIGYLNCYLLMSICMVVAIPICLLFKSVRKQVPDEIPLLASDH